jgi:hypothetical protein
MKVDDLIASCKAIDPIDGKPVGHIYLIIQNKRLPRGFTVGLVGRAGPRGTICNVKEVNGRGYESLAIFKCSEVLAWIEKVKSQ